MKRKVIVRTCSRNYAWTHTLKDDPIEVELEDDDIVHAVHYGEGGPNETVLHVIVERPRSRK
jgi:hypothetical protein